MIIRSKSTIRYLLPVKTGDYVADLNLLKEKFGITIIVPKKLADDDAVLKLCGLDRDRRTVQETDFLSIP